MTPNNLVEAVARAIANASGGYDMWKNLSEFKRRKWREIAKAAILAVLEGIREPTAEMIEAASAAPDRGAYAEIVVGEWTAMIDQLITTLKDTPHA